MPPDEIPTMTEDEYNQLLQQEDNSSAFDSIPTVTEDEYNALASQPEDYTTTLARDTSWADSIPEQDNWYTPLKTLGWKSAASIADSVGGLSQALGDQLGADAISDFGRRRREESAIARAYADAISGYNDGDLGQRVTDVIGGALPVAASLPLGGSAALASMGLQAAGSKYGALRDIEDPATGEPQIDPTTALTDAALSGGFTAATGAIPLGFLGKSTGPLLSRYLQDTAKFGAANVPISAVQTAGDAMIDDAVAGLGTDLPTLEERVARAAGDSLITAPLFGAMGAYSSRPGAGVDAEALGARLKEKFLSQPQKFDGDSFEPPKPPEPLRELPEQTQANPERPPEPPDALPLPEANPVVSVTKPIKAPNSETSSFPDPVKDAEPEVVIEVQTNRAQERVPSEPLENAPTPWRILRDMAEELAPQLKVSELDPTQKWFQGQVYGKDVPLVSSSLAWLRRTSMPRTISKKFPEASRLYEGGRREVEGEAMVSQQMTEMLRPYFKADNPALVDAYIGQVGEITKQFQRERSAATKRLRDVMREANDLASGRIQFDGTPEQVKQYAAEVTAKAQAELDALERRTTPRDSEEVMRAEGLTENDRQAVLAHRTAMNYAAEHLREVFKLQGRKIKNPDTKKQYDADVDEYVNGLLNTNYFPAARSGAAWAAVARDKDGNVIWRVDSNSKYEARQQARAFMLKNKGAKVEMLEKPQIDPDAFPDMPANLAEAIKSFRPEKWTEAAQQRPPMGFTKHLIEAQKIPGYDPNIRMSTIDYVLGLSKYYGRQQAKAVLDDLVSNLPEGSAIRGYAQRYADTQLVKPEYKSTKALLKFQNFMKLALVPTSALINTTQTLTTTFPKLEGELIKAYGAAGAMKQSPKVWAQVTGEAFAYLADRTGGKMVGAKTRKLAPELFRDLDEAAKIGIFEAEGLRELYNLKQKIKGTPTAADSLMFMFSTAERANRVIAFLAGRAAGKARGIEGKDLFSYAKDFVQETQFDQTIANRPPALSHGIPRVLTQYRPFQLNYLRFLRNNFNAKDLPVVGLSMAAMLGLGGALALPFAPDMKRTAESLGMSPIRSFRRFIGDEKWADRLLYGLPMDAGVSISGAVSPGEFTVSDVTGRGLVKLLGPTADYFVNQIPKAYEAYTTQNDPYIAAEIAGPRFMRGPLKNFRARQEGVLRNYQGSPLLTDLTGTDQAALAVGATPSRLQKEREIDSETFRLLNRAKSKPRDYNSLVAEALDKGDGKSLRELLLEIQSWNQSHSPAEQIQLNNGQIKDDFISRKSRYAGAFRGMPKKAREEYLQMLAEYGKSPLGD